MKATFGWFCVYLVLAVAWYANQLNDKDLHLRTKAQQCFDWLFWPGIVVVTIFTRPLYHLLQLWRGKHPKKGRLK